MKKLIFIFSIILFTATSVHAQENVLFGIKAGVNFTNMNSDDYADYNTVTGLNIGLLAEIPLTSSFSIQPEVLYALQGVEAEELMIGSGPKTTEYNLDYIQVPVLAKFYLIRSLSIEGGPSFNFLVKEERDGEASELANGFEFGGALGVSYKFGNNFFGSARYTIGFTDVYDQDIRDSSAKNQGFQVGVGYLF